jgi:hydrogenase 3 maturation protease
LLCVTILTAAPSVRNAYKAAGLAASKCLMRCGNWLQSRKNRLKSIMEKKKISSSYWKTQLRESLKLLANDPAGRVAVLGIGNELNGDDSAGNWVARKLKERLINQPNLFVMDCGAIPENASGPLRRFQPQLILLMDAADLDESPGAIQLVNLDQVRGFSASSHSLPLSVLAEFMKHEFQSEVVLCCIQPQSLEFEANLSTPVKKAVNSLVAELASIILEKSKDI